MTTSGAIPTRCWRWSAWSRSNGRTHFNGWSLRPCAPRADCLANTHFLISCPSSPFATSMSPASVSSCAWTSTSRRTRRLWRDHQYRAHRRGAAHDPVHPGPRRLLPFLRATSVVPTVRMSAKSSPSNRSPANWRSLLGRPVKFLQRLHRIRGRGRMRRAQTGRSRDPARKPPLPHRGGRQGQARGRN